MEDEQSPFFNGIIFPSDFSRASLAAFYHALFLALRARAHLRMVHVDPPDARSTLTQFPRVRETISQWKGLPQRATEQDLNALGVSVHKTVARHTDPVEALRKIIRKHQTNFLVLTPHQHSGLNKLFRKSRSVKLLQHSGGFCLLLPEGTSGIVDYDGKLALNHILVPVGKDLPFKQLLDLARQFCGMVGVSRVKLSLLWMETGSRPDLSAHTADAFWDCSWLEGSGASASEIADAARQVGADLIAWVPPRRSGPLAFLRSDATEELVTQTPCAILKFPIEL